jgi:hypothetical protein
MPGYSSFDLFTSLLVMYMFLSLFSHRKKDRPLTTDPLTDRAEVKAFAISVSLPLPLEMCES